jgi:hypothetical protein
LLELDRGEKQTIALAMEKADAVVIIDEKIGRNLAEYLGLRVIGTLGVLVQAKRRGLVSSFRTEVDRMIHAGLRYNRQLVERICHDLGE